MHEINEESQFNAPKTTVDAKRHNVQRERLREEKELEDLRGEIERLKVKIAEWYEKYKKKEKSAFLFVGDELECVKAKELTLGDLRIYKAFKDFKRGKIEANDFFAMLGKHRYSVAEYTDWLREEVGKDLEFIQKDSRVNFLAWLQNKYIEEMMKRRMKARGQNKTIH